MGVDTNRLQRSKPLTACEYLRQKEGNFPEKTARIKKWGNKHGLLPYSYKSYDGI